MKTALKIISFVALACIIIPPLLYLASAMDKPVMKWVMILGSVAWFVTVPFWMGKKA